MLEKVEEVRGAVAKIVDGKMTIWNARLDMAVQTSDVRKIDALLAHSPVADGSGCDCNCFGISIPGQEVIQPK